MEVVLFSPVYSIVSLELKIKDIAPAEFRHYTFST